MDIAQYFVSAYQFSHQHHQPYVMGWIYFFTFCFSTTTKKKHTHFFLLIKIVLFVGIKHKEDWSIV